MKKNTIIFFILFLGLIISINSLGNTSNPKHLIIIDNSLPNVEYLVNSINLPSSKIIYIDPAKYEGIVKLTDELKKLEEIESIHIVGHGNPAEMIIGNDSFYGDDIFANRTIFESWKNYVSADADLMLYGCSIASTDEGKEFVENLSSLTGMDVEASTNLTGHVSLGGDWNLEYTAGAIETTIAFSAAIENYEFTLQGLDYADLRNYDKVDESGSADGVWSGLDESGGRTAYQSANTSKPVYLLSTETGVINKVFKGTIAVDSDAGDDDDIGFAFGYQGYNDTYIWSWDTTGVAMGSRTNGGHLLYHKTSTPANFSELPGTLLGVKDGTSECWVHGVTYQFEILYTSNRIRIKVDGVEKFNVSVENVEGISQFPAGRFGFYNYSQGGVTFGNVQTAPASDEAMPPTAQDDSYGMAPKHRINS